MENQLAKVDSDAKEVTGRNGDQGQSRNDDRSLFLKGVAIPGQIVPILNVILFVIIFVLSFGGLRYVLSPTKDILVPVSPQLDSKAELEQLQQQREQAKAEQLRQEQAQQRLELERLAQEKAHQRAELEKLRQERAAAEQPQQKSDLARKQAAESLVRSYYDDLNRQDSDMAISRWWAPTDKIKRRITSSIGKFSIKEVRAAPVGEESAEVYVDVISKKSADSNPERWSGPIRLKWAGDEWKIEDVKG